MSIDIVLLGTGSPMPDPNRAGPSTLISAGEIDPNGAQKVLQALTQIDTVVNIFDFEDAAQDPEIQALMAQRTRARQAQDWELADHLRDRLLALGVVPRDERTVE